LPQQRTEGGEPSAPAKPGLLLLSYTTPRDAALNLAVEPLADAAHLGVGDPGIRTEPIAAIRASTLRLENPLAQPSMITAYRA